MKTLEKPVHAGGGRRTEGKRQQGFDLDERLRRRRTPPSASASPRRLPAKSWTWKFTSLGVVGPRDAILDLVPLDGKLIMEGRIRPEDINYVAVGMADVRLTAFKSRLTPVVAGRVVPRPADRLVERTSGTPYYTVHVDVAPEELQKAGNLRLQAGMPVEVLIKTAERTAMQYLLDPVTAFVGRSLREP